MRTETAPYNKNTAAKTAAAKVTPSPSPTPAPTGTPALVQYEAVATEQKSRRRSSTAPLNTHSADCSAAEATNNTQTTATIGDGSGRESASVERVRVVAGEVIDVLLLTAVVVVYAVVFSALSLLSRIQPANHQAFTATTSNTTSTNTNTKPHPKRKRKHSHAIVQRVMSANQSQSPPQSPIASELSTATLHPPPSSLPPPLLLPAVRAAPSPALSPASSSASVDSGRSGGSDSSSPMNAIQSFVHSIKTKIASPRTTSAAAAASTASATSSAASAAATIDTTDVPNRCHPTVDVEDFDDSELDSEAAFARAIAILTAPTPPPIGAPTPLLTDDSTAWLRRLEHALARLTEIDVRLYTIGDAGAQRLAAALAANQSLRSIRLFMSAISSNGGGHIAAALTTNRSLTALNLDRNNLGPMGTKYIADALQTNCALEVLYLRNNRIGADGAIHLAAALRVNQSLKLLNLKGNAIGDDGALALAAALRVNRHLESLDLVLNRISSIGGGLALLAALDDGLPPNLHCALSAAVFGDDPNALSPPISQWPLTNRRIASVLLAGNHDLDQRIATRIACIATRNALLHNYISENDSRGDVTSSEESLARTRRIGRYEMKARLLQTLHIQQFEAANQLTTADSAEADPTDADADADAEDSDAAVASSVVAAMETTVAREQRMAERLFDVEFIFAEGAGCKSPTLRITRFVV